MNEITRILSAIEQGEPKAAAQLLPLVYDELRKLAAHKMAQEKPGQTLEATALVHEAYVRLVGKDDPRHWSNRAHFFGAAAEAMRRILIESARRKKSEKHGGHWHRFDLLETELAIESTSDNMLSVDEALSKLAAVQPEAAKVVELRFFAGLTLEDIAPTLGISVRTVHRHWAYARAWLGRELSRDRKSRIGLGLLIRKKTWQVSRADFALSFEDKRGQAKRGIRTWHRNRFRSSPSSWKRWRNPRRMPARLTSMRFAATTGNCGPTSIRC